MSLDNNTRWLKLLVYGGYGAGKTRLASSAILVPEMRDALFIDAEAGELTVATIDDPQWNTSKEYIDVVRVKNFSVLARVQEFLKVHCMYRDLPPEEGEPKLKELEAKLFPGRDPGLPARRYNTAIIDSLSEVETFSMYQLLGITDRTRIDEEAATAEWSEFKKNHTQILRMVRSFRDLPMNIIFTAAEAYIQDEQKRFKYMPMLTGKLAKQCQGFMDVVGFLAQVQGEDNKAVRRMFTRPTPRWDAKCRFSSFKGDYFDEPTLRSILESVGLLRKAVK